MSPLFLLLMVGLPLLSQFVATTLRKRFVRYSTDPMPFTGAETAQRMLLDNNINDVQVVPTSGELTDHYDPRTKTIALSEVVYSRANVAACSVAAHECGHAVQHATKYPFLGLRSKMVPFLKLSNAVFPIIYLGGAGIMTYGNPKLISLGLLGVLGVPALFSLVTLPVEFDASRRALRWMEASGITDESNHSIAKKALWWAAMTYVVAALGSVAQVVYYAKYLLRR